MCMLKPLSRQLFSFFLWCISVSERTRTREHPSMMGMIRRLKVEPKGKTWEPHNLGVIERAYSLDPINCRPGSDLHCNKYIDFIFYLRYLFQFLSNRTHRIWRYQHYIFLGTGLLDTLCCKGLMVLPPYCAREALSLLLGHAVSACTPYGSTGTANRSVVWGCSRWRYPVAGIAE